MPDMKIFTGNSNPDFAQKVADHAGIELGKLNQRSRDDVDDDGGHRQLGRRLAARVDRLARRFDRRNIRAVVLRNMWNDSPGLQHRLCRGLADLLQRLLREAP